MFARSLMLVGLFSMISGCTGVYVQDEPAPRGNYWEREFDYATRKGAIWTIVVGNPYGGSDKEFADLVRKTMYQQNRELPAEFVGNKSDRTSAPYKVVVVFNKTLSASPDELCAKSAGNKTIPEKSALRIDIAFCNGDTAKSDTSGYAENVSGIAHPNFAALIRQATYTMLPEPGATERENQSENILN